MSSAKYECTLKLNNSIVSLTKKKKTENSNINVVEEKAGKDQHSKPEKSSTKKSREF